MRGFSDAGQLLELDIRRLQQPEGLHQTAQSPAAYVDCTARRPSVTGVLGRRYLPSRGLPASALSPTPLKRCRLDTASSQPADVVGLTDDEGDWNKGNRRPHLKNEQTGAMYRRRRRHVECDDRLQSPANHIYHTLEPAATWSTPACLVSSPIYEAIDPDDTIDKLHVTSYRLQRHSKIRNTNKKVTFNLTPANR